MKLSEEQFYAVSLVAELLYGVVGFATFIYLDFFDGYVYTAWNWIIVIPCNVFLASIWPIYWISLH